MAVNNNGRTMRDRVDVAFQLAAQAFREDADDWWPQQAEGYVFSWALALEWAFGTEGFARRLRRGVWLSSNLGGNPGASRAVARQFRFGAPTARYAGERYTPRGNRRISTREFLLDFTLWPVGDQRDDDLLLSMESEMYAGYDVGANVTLTNGYAYDFYRLLLVPSPRRLFVARINRFADRIRRLKRSLTELAQGAKDRGYLRPNDELVCVILPSAVGDRANIAVWRWNANEPEFLEV
jgi:hypothetical protein